MIRHLGLETMHIDASEISVVIQGPVVTRCDGQGRDRQNLTLKCLNSIRCQLEGAEIILSTWKGETVCDLPFDKLLLNDDPDGTICHRCLDIYNNVNRQIVSTKNGIIAATRKYVLKIRSDLELEHLGFLEYYGRFNRYDERMRLLQQRILVCSVFSKNPKRVFPFPFHPSDWFHFGLREDVLALWDIPLAREPETSRWFETHMRPDPDLYPSFLCRYLPEQYIWLSFLRKHWDVSFEHIWDCTSENIELSERSIVNNLVILEPKRIGIRSSKYGFNLIEWLSLYSYGEWFSLYKKHCDPEAGFSLNLICLVKNCLIPLSYLTPLRIARFIINAVLRSNQDFFPAWERKSPRTYRFCLKIYNWLAH